MVGGGGSDGGGVKAFFLTFVAPIVSLLVSRLLACLGQRQKSLVLIHCFPQIIFPSATCCYLVPFGLEWRTLPHSSLCCHSICLPNYYFFLSLSLSLIISFPPCLPIVARLFVSVLRMTSAVYVYAQGFSCSSISVLSCFLFT